MNFKADRNEKLEYNNTKVKRMKLLYTDRI